MSLATPLLMMAYATYRVASREAFRVQAGVPKRILAVRLDTIGDVLLSEPAIRSLKLAFPEAQVDLMVGAAGKAVLSGNPSIDRFIVYDAPWHAAWRGGNISWRHETARALCVVRELRRNRYDLVIEMRGDPRDIALIAASGAALKVGNGWRGGGFILDVDADADIEAHRVEFALQIAAAIGASAEPSRPKLWLEERHRQMAETHLPKDGDIKYVAVHLGAGFPSKCLPIRKFAEVASALVTNSGVSDRQIVVVGGKGEESRVEEFSRLLGASLINLAGRLNLLETAAVLEKCALFVGNDSGPMHLAAAVGTPVVTFFGPSEPHKYRPYGVPYRLIEIPLPCRPCDHIHCSQPENICMTQIEVADIVAASEELLLTHRLAAEQTA